MTAEKSPKSTRLCPTCGTRVSENAARCLVCGTDLSGSEKTARSGKAVQGSRMPEVTLSLPAVLGLVVLFLAVGALLVYVALRQTNPKALDKPTATPTNTATPTATITPTPQTPTPTNTPLPTPTPLTYKVVQGDTCSSIAYAFKVSINSIVLLNNLPATCDTLYVGQPLQIPQPTPTATAQPTATLSPAEATEAACQKLEYTIQTNDTLSSISLNYNIPMDAIREYNGLVNDTVRSGQKLVLPLCRRGGVIGGPTPTPTMPPPYPAPNLLLPADGAPFTASSGPVSLQWASVGALRQNESYAVTLEDVTEGQNRRLVEYLADTKYIVPLNFLPADNLPHVIRWWVVTARQVGTDNEGNPIWQGAGAASAPRVFTWVGSGAQPLSTPTP